jgi:hypothetical protein
VLIGPELELELLLLLEGEVVVVDGDDVDVEVEGEVVVVDGDDVDVDVEVEGDVVVVDGEVPWLELPWLGVVEPDETFGFGFGLGLGTRSAGSDPPVGTRAATVAPLTLMTSAGSVAAAAFCLSPPLESASAATKATTTAAATRASWRGVMSGTCGSEVSRTSVARQPWNELGAGSIPPRSELRTPPP